MAVSVHPLVPLAFVLLMPLAAGAGIDTWTSNGPYGGSIPALAIDTTTSPATVYAGTEGSGVFKTTDGGSSWSAANTNLTNAYVLALAIDGTTSPATVYAGTDNGGVAKSTNGGTSWSPVNTNLTNHNVQALAIDGTTSPATVYAGTHGGGVFKSTSGGSSWSSVNTNLTNTDIVALAIDSTTSPTTVYAGTGGGGAFKTTDRGSSWSVISTNLTNVYIHALAIDSTTSPATVYGSTLDGVFRSSSGGSSWTNLTNHFVYALAIDATTRPATVYAGAGGIGVLKTSDGGNSWSAVNTNLTSPSIHALAIDATASPVTVYAGTGGSGVFKTTDGGNSWSAVDTNLTNVTVFALAIDATTSSATVYAGTLGGGVFKSTNGGSSWTMTNPTVLWGSALAIDATTRPTTLYVGTYGGMFKTTDNGSSWSAVNTNLTNRYIQALAIDATTSPATVYAGTGYGGVFKSTSGGSSWSAVNTNLTNTNIRALAIDAATSPATVYAGTGSGGVFKSTSGGNSWSAVNTNLTNTNVNALAIDATTSPATVYAGTYRGGVFKSTSGGSSWSAVNTNLTDLDIRDLETDGVSSPATVYAGTHGGVFKSVSGGSSWSAINTNLTSPYVNALAIDATTSPATVYAGTSYRGVFGIQQITTLTNTPIHTPTSTDTATIRPSPTPTATVDPNLPPLQRGLRYLNAGNLHDADIAFAQARTAAPNDEASRLFSCLSRLGVVVAENMTFRNLATRAGVAVMGSATDVCQLDVVVPPTVPNTAPRIGELIDSVRTILLPEIETAIACLGTLSTGVNIAFNVGDLPACVGPDLSVTVVEIDRGDILGLLSGLEGAAAALHLMLGYNLDANLKLAIDGTKKAVFDSEPQLLNLISAPALAAARQDFDLAFGHAIDGIDVIRHEVDNQDDDILVIDPEDVDAARKASLMLSTVRQALTMSVELPIDLITGHIDLLGIGLVDTDRLNLSVFFDWQLASLRGLLAFDPAGEVDGGHFPDPTFAGIAPDLTQYKIDNLLIGGPECATCESDDDCDPLGIGEYYCEPCYGFGCNDPEPRCRNHFDQPCQGTGPTLTRTRTPTTTPTRTSAAAVTPTPVSGIVISLGNASAAPGGAAVFDVTLSGVTAGGIKANNAQVDILFPTAVFNVASASAVCALDPRLAALNHTESLPTAPSPGIGNQRLRLNIIDSTTPLGDVTDGRLYTCTFPVKPDAPLGPVTLTASRQNVGDTSGVTLSSRTVDGSVDIIPAGTGSATPTVSAASASTRTPSRTITSTAMRTPTPTRTNTFTPVPGSGQCSHLGPEGVYVSDLSVDPASGAIYAATAFSEMGVITSMNGGRTWIIPTPSLDDEVTAVAVDPVDAEVVYAGTYLDVYKSTNGGGTWSKLGLEDFIQEMDVYALAIRPNSRDTVYAATSGGVIRTMNGGSSWGLSNSGMMDSYVDTLAIVPSVPDVMFAGQEQGLFKSSNGGTTWSLVYRLPTGIVTGFAMDPTDSSVAYAGTIGGGVLKTTNRGDSWVVASSGIADDDINAVAIDNGDHLTVYAGTRTQGIFKSTNAGTSWSQLDKAATGSEVNTLATHPILNGTVYAGPRGKGVIRSTDGGGTWESAEYFDRYFGGITVRLLATSAATPDVIFAGDDWIGMEKSVDRGRSWFNVSEGLSYDDVWQIARAPTDLDTMYVGTLGSGVFKSTNGGATWNGINAGLEDLVVSAVAVDPVQSEVLFAGTEWLGIWRSTTGGTDWKHVGPEDFDSVSRIAFDPSEHKRVYAASFNYGLFKSTDAGDTWTSLGEFWSVEDLQIEPSDPAIVYIAAYDYESDTSGVLKSTDHGATWAMTGLVDYEVLSLAIDVHRPGTLYAGLSGSGYDPGGVFKTTDGGTTWESLHSCLVNLSISSLAIDPHNPLRLYAGTEEHGVFVIEQEQPTITPTSTPSQTPTVTSSATRTATATPSVTPTPTRTPTATPTSTVTPTSTPTATRTVTPTRTPSTTPTATPTHTPPVDLVADAVEVTQAIQDWGNSVRLVADKRTYVRVHTHAKTGQHVTTARLVAERGGTSVTLSPLNAGAKITVRSGPSRGVLDHSFLFLLPSSMNDAGTVHLRGEVNPQGMPAEVDTSNNAVEATVLFEPVPKQTLVLYAVDYELGGRRYTVADRMRQLVSNWLRRAYPVGDLSVVQRTQVVGNAAAVDGILERPSCFDVNNFLTTKRVFDVTAGSVPANARYYGMVGDDGALLSPSCAAGVPGRVATGAVGAMAYGAWDTDGTYGDWLAGRELGHTFGRASAEFCQARQANGYPHPNGQISPVLYGQGALYGFDVVTRQIYGPDWKDVMSDCLYVWMSDYTYEGLMDSMQQEGIQARAQRATAVDRVLVVGTLDPINQRVELEPPFVVSGAEEILVRVPGSYAIVLRNASGGELARYAFTPREAATTGGETGGSGTLRFIQEMVPVVAGMARIEIVGPGGQVLASVSGGGSAPVVRLTAPNGGVLPDTGQVMVRWEASDADGDTLSFAVQYSADDGATWELLAAYVTGNEVAIDVTNLDPTQIGRFRVLASDGVHTASDVSDATITVGARAISVRVTSPTATVSQGQTLLLEAEVTGATVNEEQVHWTSSREGELGRGTSLAVTGLSVGVHTITVSVDNSTVTTTDQVEITVVAAIGELPPVEDQMTAGPSLIRLDLGAGVTTATLYLDNERAGQPLNWMVAGLPAWVEITAVSGTTPAEVQLRVRTSRLAPGRYEAALAVSGEHGEPVEIVLELTVPCAGDCDGDGQVTMGDLVRGVDSTLGREPTVRCFAVDANLDGEATIDELVTGVRAIGPCT